MYAERAAGLWACVEQVAVLPARVGQAVGLPVCRHWQLIVLAPRGCAHEFGQQCYSQGLGLHRKRLVSSVPDQPVSAGWTQRAAVRQEAAQVLARLQSGAPDGSVPQSQKRCWDWGAAPVYAGYLASHLLLTVEAQRAWQRSDVPHLAYPLLLAVSR